MNKPESRSFYLPVQQVKEFCGPSDKHLKVLHELMDTRITARGNNIIFTQSNDKTDSFMRLIQELLNQGETLSERRIKYIYQYCSNEENEKEDIVTVFREKIQIGIKRNGIYPKTHSQYHYIKNIRNNDIVFGIGPAGTGKTYLAMAMAVESLLKKQIERIILVRPAVEAGEKLGFLPGDMVEKVNPYLRPLYDALYDMLTPESINQYMEQGTIEVAPLAFMRGRTLSHAFIILDEAQNTTVEQMKMFLTRLGRHSKTLITGDITQIDLPRHSDSGLIHVRKILHNIEGISFSNFSKIDVIRHPLVEKIIEAYESDEAKK